MRALLTTQFARALARPYFHPLHHRGQFFHKSPLFPIIFVFIPVTSNQSSLLGQLFGLVSIDAPNILSIIQLLQEFNIKTRLLLPIYIAYLFISTALQELAHQI